MRSDHRAVLVDAVVVDGDRGRADIGALADGGVADVGEVGHLGALAQLRVLDLDIGADLGLAGQPGPRAQVGVGAGGGQLADLGTVRGGVAHTGAGADPGVLEGGVRAHLGALAQVGRALQLGVGQYHRVRLVGDLDVEPGGRRVHHGHAGPHRPLQQPVVQQPAGVRQLHPVVDAEDVPVVGGDHRAHPVAGPAQDLQGVGQVLLALRVVRGDLGERAHQQLGVEGEDPGVDLVDLPLGVRGVLLLDDRGDRAVRLVAQDPAVAERLRDHGGEHGDAVALLGVRPGQGAQRPAGQQRGVPGGDDHGAVELDAVGRQRLQGGAHGVAGTVLLGLDHRPGTRVMRRQVLGDLLPHVPDHHDQLPGRQLLRRRDRVADQRPPAHLVQHLRQTVRLHPGPATGGEHDNGGRRIGTHGGRLLIRLHGEGRAAGDGTRTSATRRLRG